MRSLLLSVACLALFACGSGGSGGGSGGRSGSGDQPIGGPGVPPTELADALQKLGREHIQPFLRGSIPILARSNQDRASLARELDENLVIQCDRQFYCQVSVRK